MDPTVVAIPGYFGTMYAEHRVLEARARTRGPSAADYEPRDTRTSLLMGVGSLVAPFVMARVLRPVTPGKGRHAKKLLAVAATAAVVTTVADRVAAGRRRAWRARVQDARRSTVAPTPATRTAPVDAPVAAVAPVAPVTAVVPADVPLDLRVADAVARAGGVVAIAAGGVLATTAWAHLTAPSRLWRRRLGPDLGAGPLALALAVAGWDFVYYWNHRFMHESRYMWAIHVVHHSSERYNLSTALRQPVADAFGTFVPYGALCLAGIRPELVATARGINLLYQYWIHTDTIRSLGPAERVLNTPSHHRVHHGSNPQYLDRNHGSILILWDKLFGTFEPEREPVVYGLTKNIHTFNPARVATHEHADMLGDVARSTTWRDRLSFVLRGPGWAYRQHARRAAGATGTEQASAAA